MELSQNRGSSFCIKPVCIKNEGCIKSDTAPFVLCRDKIKECDTMLRAYCLISMLVLILTNVKGNSQIIPKNPKTFFSQCV